MKLLYYFKERVYRRRDIVYKEGEVAEGVYFIKEGEFEVSFKADISLIIFNIDIKKS